MRFVLNSRRNANNRHLIVRDHGSAVSQAFTAASSKFIAFELAADLTYCGFTCDAKFSFYAANSIYARHLLRAAENLTAIAEQIYRTNRCKPHFNA